MTAFGVLNGGSTPTNVVALNARQHRQPLSERLARHAGLFVSDRRSENDVFWLKENAEFLNILEASDCTADAQGVCEAYAETYDTISARLGAYPQYYRFILSIALDLEDLGLSLGRGAQMCEWVRDQDLPGAELSDLQRAEARRLLARRDMATDDPALTARLHRFIDRTATFAVPNRKAAYELTHIVFYLSEYGRCDPSLSADAVQSLTFTGLLAYLDQNYDLLAEVCIALRYAGQQPSAIWETAVMGALRTASAQPLDLEPGYALADDSYHAYFVSTWLAGLGGQRVMPLILSGGCARLDIAPPQVRPLQQMSRALSDMSGDDWGVAKQHLMSRLDDTELSVLEAAETSSEQFGSFYQVFARATQP
ncbi:MAG: hypothetical protein ABJL99_21590 [Aliishimia sp.]